MGDERERLVRCSVRGRKRRGGEGPPREQPRVGVKIQTGGAARGLGRAGGHSSSVGGRARGCWRWPHRVDVGGGEPRDGGGEEDGGAGSQEAGRRAAGR